MLEDGKIYIGTSRNPDDSINTPEYLELKFGNRHGLVTGATGTGKTVTLQVMAEGFARAGVPVFCADIKGDLSGIALKGQPQEWMTKRAEQIGFDDYDPDQFPVIFWPRHLVLSREQHDKQRVRVRVRAMPLMGASFFDLDIGGCW